MQEALPKEKRTKPKWRLLRIKHYFRRPSFFSGIGSYIITGYPGAGKGVLTSHLIQNIDPNKYFFYSNIDEFKTDNVKVFDLDKVFYDGKQQAQFPRKDEKGRRLYAVIFDEINLNFNRRINQKREYIDKFLGIMEFITTHRHQGVPRVWFLGQKIELQDTQLKSMFKYQVDIIGSRKKAPYWLFKETGVLSYVPFKLKIVQKIKGQNDDFLQVSKLKKIKMLKRDIENYNDKALSSNYSSLPYVQNKRLTKK